MKRCQKLGLPVPHVHLGIGSGTHAEQTGGVMIAYEKVCKRKPPYLVVVVGDVNSTMACALSAKKLNIKVAHLEAGLRSRDMTMPEEINRIVTDAISDILWTPSSDADRNLIKEGIQKERIALVGNIMIDSYEMLRKKIESENMAVRLGLKKEQYCVITLHRPNNVDDKTTLGCIVSLLTQLSKTVEFVFPVHPRTKARLHAFNLWHKLNSAPRIHLTPPLQYVHFMSLVQNAKFLITDSGGIQEETTYLNIPCLTLRNTTERPITITQGTNQLATIKTLKESVRRIIKGKWKESTCPRFWDGHTAERVVENIKCSIKKWRV